MRLVGILLIIAGLYLAVAKPWFSTNFTGEVIAKANVYDKRASTSNSHGWQIANVFLEKEKSPAVVRIIVDRLSGKLYDNGKFKLLVRVAPISSSGETQTPILNEAVTVNLDTNNTSNPPQNTTYATAISSSAFNIERTGNYKLGAFPVADNNVAKGAADLDIDANITNITATVLSGVEPVQQPNTFMGFSMIVMGVILMSIFRRRARRRQQEAVVANEQPRPVELPPEDVGSDAPQPVSPPRAPPVKPKPVARKTQVGKTIKWGRDAGKKR